MKIPNPLLYTLLLMLSTTSLIAQSDWQWGQEIRVDAQHLAVDNNGNTYVTWTLENNYTIDGENFVSNGSYDAALTSFDCDGVHRWTKIIGGQSSDTPWGLGTDTLGGVYLYCNTNVGREENYELNTDTDTSVTTNRKSMLLVKYNSQGDFQWQQMPEDTVVFDFDNLQFASGLDLNVAPNGDCYIYSKLVIGTYGDEGFEATFDGIANEGEDIYALKYDSDGNCTGGMHFDMFYSGGGLVSAEFTRDPYTGRFYVSGNVNQDNSTLILGGEEVTAENYIVQFDPDGNVNWNLSMNDIGDFDSQFIGKPSVDVLGNVYVTGNAPNGSSFGDFTFQNNLGGLVAPIFAKVNSIGVVVYATNASTNSSSSGQATAYSNSEVGVTGYWGSIMTWSDVGEDITDGDNQGSNIFLTFFDAEGDGTPESFHSLTSSPLGNETPTLLTADRQGNFYVGGHFSGTVDIGDGSIYNQSGPQEGFIAKFGTDSCYCPLPEAAFAYDTIPDAEGYDFVYNGTTDVDSVVWDFGDGNSGLGINPQHTYTQSGTYTVCATAYNDCGADSMCIDIVYVGSIGVKEIDGFEALQVYPNPARESLTIGNAEPGTRVVVINAVGSANAKHSAIHQPSANRCECFASRGLPPTA